MSSALAGVPASPSLEEALAQRVLRQARSGQLDENRSLPGQDKRETHADLRTELTGNQRTLPRTQLLRHLRKHRARAAFRRERRTAGTSPDRVPEGAGDRDPGDTSRRGPRRETGEPARGGVGRAGPDRGAVQRGEGGGGAAVLAGLCARERLRAVRGARRRGSRRWGRVSE